VLGLPAVVCVTRRRGGAPMGRSGRLQRRWPTSLLVYSINELDIDADRVGPLRAPIGDP